MGVQQPDVFPDLSKFAVKSKGDESVARVVDDELTKLGWSDNSRLSALGDIGRENNWDRKTIFSGHVDPASYTNGRGKIENRGIISWNGDRRANLDNYLKSEGVLGKGNDDELRGMVRFMDKEMQDSPEWSGIHRKMRDPNISTFDASENLRKYIKYNPGGEYNSYDPNFRVKNNANWANRAKRAGLGSLPDLSQFSASAALPDLSQFAVSGNAQPQTSPTFAGQTPNTLPQAPVVGNAAPKTNDAIPEGFQGEPDPAYMATFAQNASSNSAGMAKMPPDAAQGAEPQLPSQVADPDYLKTLKDNNLDDTPELRDRWQKAIAGEVPEFLSTEMLQKAQDAKTPAATLDRRVKPAQGATDKRKSEPGETIPVPLTKPQNVSAKQWYEDTATDAVAQKGDVSRQVAQKFIKANGLQGGNFDEGYAQGVGIVLPADLKDRVKAFAEAHPDSDNTPDEEAQIQAIAHPTDESIAEAIKADRAPLSMDSTPTPGVDSTAMSLITKGYNYLTGRDGNADVTPEQIEKYKKEKVMSEADVRAAFKQAKDYGTDLGALRGGLSSYQNAANAVLKMTGIPALNSAIDSIAGRKIMPDLSKELEQSARYGDLVQNASRLGDDSILMDLRQGVVRSALDIPRFVLLSKIPGLGSATATIAADNLLQSVGKDEGLEKNIIEGEKGAALGAVFGLMPKVGSATGEAIAKKTGSALLGKGAEEAVTAVGTGAGAYATEKAFGAKDSDAFRAAVNLSGLHLVGKVPEAIGSAIKFVKGKESGVGVLQPDGNIKPTDEKPQGVIDLTKVSDDEWQKLGGKMPTQETTKGGNDATTVTPKTTISDITDVVKPVKSSAEAASEPATPDTKSTPEPPTAKAGGSKGQSKGVPRETIAPDHIADISKKIAPESAEISTGKEKPEAEQEERGVRSLPKTMEAAGLEKGDNTTYDPEKISRGIDRGREIVKEKGVDAAIEFVRHSNGIEWAPTGYAALEHLRNQEAEVRATDPAKADEIQKKRADFLDEFAEEATKRGQSIVGIKAIEEFAPDRAAYLLNKASQRARKRQISPLEDARITDLGKKLEAERVRSSGLEAQLAEAQKGKSSRKVKTPTYLDTLEQEAESAKTEILTRKIDLSGLAKSKQLESQKGAIGEQRELPGDAELVAKYAAGQLHKIDTVENLNKHLVETFGKEIEPHLSDIRQRAYQIRQEARIASLESPTTTAEARRTIIQDIKKEIAESNAAETTRMAESAQKEKALTAEAFKAQKADARAEATQALADQKAKDKALAAAAKQRAKDYERNLIAARKAETKGYRESIRAKKQAEKEANFWDTPLRNIAAEAKTRLETADPKSPDTLSDLASVGAEKFLRDSKGGVPGKRTISPMQFYREMQTEYPNLVTNKNKGEIYKQAYQRIQDAVEAGRNAIELNSAKKAEKVIWEEQGLDTNTQALLIQKATNARRQHEIRSEMANEFNRVSQPLYKRVGKEILNAPRALQTTLNMHQGRQGLFTLLTHPTIAFNTSIPQTIRGFRASKLDFVKLTEQLKQDPMFPLAEQSGLNIAELPRASTDLKGHIEEDQLQSSVTMKLPWVRKSTQGFVLGMNSERLALFKKWAAIGEANGYTFENNPKFFEQAASVANDFTGRGVAPEAIEKTIGKMNQLLYAPRLKVSQVKAVNDLFNPFNYFGKNAYDPVMKKIMIQNAVKATVGFAAMYATLVAMGGKGTDDPDDPDFGKIVFGHTHYDLTGGAGATFKAAYKLITSIYGYLFGAKQNEYEKPLAIAWGFVRKKLAPWPSAVIDYFTGKNAVGQPANLKADVSDIPKTMKENIALRMVLPLVVNEITEGVMDGGWAGLAKSGIPSVMGVSEQTYVPSSFSIKEKLKTEKDPAVRNQLNKDLGEASKIEAAAKTEKKKK